MPLGYLVSKFSGMPGLPKNRCSQVSRKPFSEVSDGISTNQNARSNRFWPLFRADCSLKKWSAPLHRSTLIHTLTTSQNGRYHEHLRLRARRPQGESSPAREREPHSSRSARSRRPGTGASNHGFLGSIRNGRVLGRRTRRPRRCHELGTGPYGRALNPCGVHRAPRRVFRGNPS